MGRSVAKTRALRSHPGDVARTTTDRAQLWVSRRAGPAPRVGGAPLCPETLELFQVEDRDADALDPQDAEPLERFERLVGPLAREPAQLADFVLRDLERPLGARRQDRIEERRERQGDARVRL